MFQLLLKQKRRCVIRDGACVSPGNAPAVSFGDQQQERSPRRMTGLESPVTRKSIVLIVAPINPVATAFDGCGNVSGV